MLYLHALGHFHPETVLDNHFLSSLDIGVDVKWIEDRVGIVERRTTLPLEYLRQTRNQEPRAAAEAAHTTATQMSVGATRMALERAGLDASQLGMIISGGCSPEMQIPADSSRIANALGIGATCFDLQSACSSFASQIHFLNQMRPEALPDYRAGGEQRDLYPHHRLQRPSAGRAVWRCGARRPSSPRACLRPR